LLGFVLTLHKYNVYLVIIAAAVSGILGMILYFAKKPVIRQWRVMLIITLVLGLLQGVLGLTMVAMGLQPGGGPRVNGLYYLHYVYGAIVALSIPLVWLSFATKEDRRKDMLLYSVAMLVMVAAAVRAWMTGPVIFHFLP
jgi:heme A synthase